MVSAMVRAFSLQDSLGVFVVEGVPWHAKPALVL